METEYNKTIYEHTLNKLQNVLVYRDNGILTNNMGYLDGSLTLANIQDDITNKRMIRYEILKKFYEDLTSKFMSKKITNFKIYIDPKKIWNGTYLNFKLVIDDKMFTPLISNSSILIDYDDNDILKIILPYIKGLITLNEETSLLNNDFYESLLVNLVGGKKPIFSISGDGVNLIKYDPQTKNDEYQLKKLFNYYASHQNEILERVDVYDNVALLPYRTDLSKRKALSIYKRGIK